MANLATVDPFVRGFADAVDRAFLDGYFKNESLDLVTEVVMPQEFNHPGNFFEVVARDGTLWRITMTQVEP